MNQYASNAELQRVQDLQISYDAALNFKHPANLAQMNKARSKDQLGVMSNNIRDKYMQMAGAQ